MAKDLMDRRESCVVEKFLISDYKEIQKNILKTTPLLKHFGVSSVINEIMEKKYFDTEDWFFKKHGINICLNVYKKRPQNDLIVSFDKTQQKRIEFISDLPNVFVIKMNKRDSLQKHHSLIASAILELIPHGVSVEPLEKIRLLQLKLSVSKKRERVRVINNQGLKIILSFEQNTYSNSKKDRVKLNILELRLDGPKDTMQQFKKFVRDLQIEEVKLIKTHNNDLLIGDEYLDL